MMDDHASEYNPFKKGDPVIWFEDTTEKEKSEVQILAECYANTTVNIAKSFGFFSLTGETRV